MKKILSLLVIFIFFGCNYTSVHKNQQKQDVFINIINTKGDFEINNYLNNDFKIYNNINSKNIYEISFETNYQKIILAKDAKGKATDFKLNLSVEFNIISQKNRKIVFNESFKIKNDSENFEQSSYEKEIKRNFSKIMSEKLITFLLK
ncbi:hypothetical protein [Candidatus Pelagibacter sp.]|uniref:hypothetical protein n=1 Tax=Candidatus Pelagibacter sp. TaxID=2024849 RepID=UPI003F842BE1